ETAGVQVLAGNFAGRICQVRLPGWHSAAGRGRRGQRPPQLAGRAGREVQEQERKSSQGKKQRWLAAVCGQPDWRTSCDKRHANLNSPAWRSISKHFLRKPFANSGLVRLCPS